MYWVPLKYKLVQGIQQSTILWMKELQIIYNVGSMTEKISLNTQQIVIWELL